MAEKNLQAAWTGLTVQSLLDSVALEVDIKEKVGEVGLDMKKEPKEEECMESPPPERVDRKDHNEPVEDVEEGEVEVAVMEHPAWPGMLAQG